MKTTTAIVSVVGVLFMLLGIASHRLLPLLIGVGILVAYYIYYDGRREAQRKKELERRTKRMSDLVTPAPPQHDENPLATKFVLPSSASLALTPSSGSSHSSDGSGDKRFSGQRASTHFSESPKAGRANKEAPPSFEQVALGQVLSSHSQCLASRYEGAVGAYAVHVLSGDTGSHIGYLRARHSGNIEITEKFKRGLNMLFIVYRLPKPEGEEVYVPVLLQEVAKLALSEDEQQAPKAVFGLQNIKSRKFLSRQHVSKRVSSAEKMKGHECINMDTETWTIYKNGLKDPTPFFLANKDELICDKSGAPGMKYPLRFKLFGRDFTIHELAKIGDIAEHGAKQTSGSLEEVEGPVGSAISNAREALDALKAGADVAPPMVRRLPAHLHRNSVVSYIADLIKDVPDATFTNKTFAAPAIKGSSIVKR